MASIAIMVGAAIVNAVAFTAGNALYDKFGRGDGSEERLRHDKAMENILNGHHVLHPDKGPAVHRT